MARSRIVFAVIVICILSEFVTACGGGNGGGGNNNPTVPGAPTIGTAIPGNAQISVAFTAPASNGGATITSYTATCTSSSSGSSSGTVSGTSSPIIVTGLTNGDPYTCTVYATNSVGNGPASTASAAVSPATFPGAPTIGTATPGNAQISVAFTAPANNGGAVITSYTATCSSSSSGSSSGTASGSSSPIIVTGLTNGDPYTCTVYATNSAGNSPSSAASAAVTPTIPAPTLTAIGPNKVYLTPTGIVPVTFTGTNFVAGDMPVCTPDSNVQNAIVVNSTTITAYLVIDSSHAGYGPRQCEVTGGTGSSNAIQFTVYGQNPVGVVQLSGEKFLLNLGEVIAGQNSGHNGYLDGFSPVTGAPNGIHCYVGVPAGVTVDNLTEFWTTDGNPNTSTCGISSSVPTPSGGGLTVTAIKVLNSYVVAIQPSATHKIACVSWIGPANSNNTVLIGDAGSAPQSLAMGTNAGKTRAYSYDAAGQALYETDAATCSNVLNWAVTGITAGAPLGTEIVMFDALGLGALISYGDNSVTIFSESTLKTITTVVPTGMPAGKVPISMIAVDSVIVIGNLDGTFTELNPVNGSASLIPSVSVSFPPTGLVSSVTADGKNSVGFYACPTDGTACLFFSLP